MRSLLSTGTGPGELRLHNQRKAKVLEDVMFCAALMCPAMLWVKTNGTILVGR